MNYDDMPWIVTDTTDDPATNYGPFVKEEAVALRERLRGSNRSAEAWAAQAPDPRRLSTVGP